MTKAELTKDIKASTGSSMPTVTEVARYLKVSRDSARELLSGLDCYNAGRAKKYFAGDVADRIMQSRGM